MAEGPATKKEPEGASDLRGTLLKRLAVAGVLVGVLLGVLAFFDYLATPEEPEPTVYTRPVPVQPKKEVTQPVKPAPDLPPPPTEEKPAETAAKEAVPEAKTEPKPETKAEAKPEGKPESKPEPRAVPVPQTHPVETPSSRPSPVPRTVPPPPPQPQPQQAARPGPAVPEATREPSVVPPKQSVESFKPSLPAEPAPLRQPAVPPRLFSGYVLQAGVFNSTKRAEELHAKLTLNGIPSTLEARVQVGPFKTREEAEAAREKMLALGIDAALIPPKGGKR